MKIFPIVANRIYSANPILSTKKSEPNIFITNPIPFDSVSFNGIKGTGNSLKKLAEYGLPDMYTGQPMLSYGALSRILKNGVFDLPLEKLVHVLIKYEDTLQDTEYYLFDLLRNMAKKKPDISINSAFQLMFSEHQEKLLNIQRPIFEKIANNKILLLDFLHLEIEPLLNKNTGPSLPPFEPLFLPKNHTLPDNTC